MHISERSKFIINALIETNDYITASEIASKLNVSTKTVARQLDNVEKILNQYNLSLQRKTSKGMRIIGSDADKLTILGLIKQSTSHEYSPAERSKIILSYLLKSQKPIKLLALSRLLNVTDTTISNDLDKLEPWINKMHMTLVRKPGLGIYLEGLEKDIRKAIINYIYENFHQKNILTLLYKWTTNKQITSSADKFLLDLVDKNIIQKVEEAIKFVLNKNEQQISMNDFSGLVVHLTLALQRLLKGETITIAPDFLAQVKAKKEFSLALKISEQLAEVFQTKVPVEETAYITMHLLGARQFYKDNANFEMPYNSFQLMQIAKQMIDIAQSEAQIKIEHKSKLLVGLVKHLGPVVTRIKLNMGIRNPLLQEMKAKYPQWMEIAKKSAKPLEQKLQCELPEAEIAYIAMHLGSALEEATLWRRKFNVIVACPTGIGTSKLLAIQLKKNFINLNVMAVTSITNIDDKRWQQADFIIATVPIEYAQKPVVVVNFMLSDADKAKIAKQIQLTKFTEHSKSQETKFTESKTEYKLVDKLLWLNQYGSYIQEILQNLFFLNYEQVKTISELCSDISRNVTDDDILAEELQNREAKGSTIIGNLMILHTKSSQISKLTVGIIKLHQVYTMQNERVNTILVMLAPQNASERALETIGQISEALVDRANFASSLFASSENEIYEELEKIYTAYFKLKYKNIMEV